MAVMAISKHIKTFYLLSLIGLAELIILTRKWLFCCQWHFTIGGYFSVIIHVCLNSHHYYDSDSDTVVCG